MWLGNENYVNIMDFFFVDLMKIVHYVNALPEEVTLKEATRAHQVKYPLNTIPWQHSKHFISPETRNGFPLYNKELHSTV